MKTPDFIGTIGVLACDGERVQCHVCGRWFHALNQHVIKKHGMTCDDYRAKYGLNYRQPLASAAFSETQRVAQTARLSQYWSSENVARLKSAERPSRPPSQQWRLANKKSMGEPELLSLRRQMMLDPAHPANSEVARQRNLQSHLTQAYRDAARARVISGVNPLLDPAVQGKATQAAALALAALKATGALKGKKRTAAQRAAQSARMKGKAPVRGKDGKFLKSARVRKEET